MARSYPPGEDMAIKFNRTLKDVMAVMNAKRSLHHSTGTRLLFGSLPKLNVSIVSSSNSIRGLIIHKWLEAIRRNFEVDQAFMAKACPNVHSRQAGKSQYIRFKKSGAL